MKLTFQFTENKDDDPNFRGGAIGIVLDEREVESLDKIDLRALTLELYELALGEKTDSGVPKLETETIDVAIGNGDSDIASGKIVKGILHGF